MKNLVNLSKYGLLKVLILVLILEIGVVFVARTMVKNHTPEVGFLFCEQDRFFLAWRISNTSFAVREFQSRVNAVKFANQQLQLTLGRNLRLEQEIEHVWLEQRFGKHRLLWKTVDRDFLNQLSLQSESDARFFYNTFRAGNYSRSPFGHALLFLPKSQNDKFSNEDNQTVGSNLRWISKFLF